MSDFKSLPKNQKLKQISDTFTYGRGAADKLNVPTPDYNRSLVQKVDPEADAEMALAESIRGSNAPIQGAEDMSQRMIVVNGQPMDMATAARTMNPETGLPYSAQMNNQPDMEDEKAKMKLQYLRDMATSGKLRR